jgi:starvation-inducible DNA-binding protein
MNKEATLKERRKAPLQTPTGLGDNARRDITGALNALLADVFALYLKTKNFHWHVSGPHFRDYHLLLDEQGDQIFAITDDIAERVRKLGGVTLHSIGNIARLQRIPDNDADYVDPLDMLAELRSDNQALIASMREAHDLCDEENDVGTTSLLEVWIDQAERRVWFLYEASRRRCDGVGRYFAAKCTVDLRYTAVGFPRGAQASRKWALRRGCGAERAFGPSGQKSDC